MQGAAVGMVISLAFMLWLQIGSILHGVPSQSLDLRTDGCPGNDDLNMTSSMFSTDFGVTDWTAYTTAETITDDR